MRLSELFGCEVLDSDGRWVGEVHEAVPMVARPCEVRRLGRRRRPPEGRDQGERAGGPAPVGANAPAVIGTGGSEEALRNHVGDPHLRWRDDRHRQPGGEPAGRGAVRYGAGVGHRDWRGRDHAIRRDVGPCGPISHRSAFDLIRAPRPAGRSGEPDRLGIAHCPHTDGRDRRPRSDSRTGVGFNYLAWIPLLALLVCWLYGGSGFRRWSACTD